VRDREPDLVRKLGADLVNAERRKQAHDGRGHAGAYRGKGVMLSRLGIGYAVKAARDVLDLTLLHEPPELIVGDP
jgi:hypothetical protein